MNEKEMKRDYVKSLVEKNRIEHKIHFIREKLEQNEKELCLLNKKISDLGGFLHMRWEEGEIQELLAEVE